MKKIKGIINWYNSMKGYGFLKSGSKEVFFHISQLNISKSYDVQLGTEVEFQIREGKQGEEAFNIKEVERGTKDDRKN